MCLARIVFSRPSHCYDLQRREESQHVLQSFRDSQKKASLKGLVPMCLDVHPSLCVCVFFFHSFQSLLPSSQALLNDEGDSRFDKDCYIIINQSSAVQRVVAITSLHSSLSFELILSSTGNFLPSPHLQSVQ